LQKEGIYGMQDELENYEHEVDRQTGEEVVLVPGEEIERIQRMFTSVEQEESYKKSIQITLEHIKRQQLEDDDYDSEEGEEELDEEDADEKKWDCETILSTYTNTDNHPGIIKSIVKPKKFQMPRIDLRSNHIVERGGFKVVETPEAIAEEPKAEEAEAEVDVSTLTPRSLKKHL
jgi:hypothetical protein